MRTIQFREAICEAMSEEMRRDESIYLMGEEVAEYNGAYKASKGMLDEFGEKRVIDTPISELGFAGIGVGSTMTGNRPIIEFMTFNFALVGIDQIINNAAKIRQMSGGQFPCPIVFRGPTASAGQLAATHSQAFESWYANCPGLKVIVPSNPYDAKGLLKSAIRDDDPVIFMESEQMYGDKGEVPDGEYVLPIGVADITRTGTDVTLVSFGKIFKEATAAAEMLEKENISVELIDLRTIRPLDINTILESVKKTNRLVILEESWPFGNISTEITYQVQSQVFDYLDAPIIKINTADTPAPYSPVLLAEWLPNRDDVVRGSRKGDALIQFQLKTNMENFIQYTPILLAIVGLLVMYIQSVWVRKQPAGTDKMQSISKSIKEGALAFLKAEYHLLLIFVIVASVALYGISTMVETTSWLIVPAFVVGAIFSALAGNIGMRIATEANARTAEAAKTSLPKALKVSFGGGAVMGLGVAGLAVFGLALWFLFLVGRFIDGSDFYTNMTIVLESLAGFSLGAESIALFARVGGGIYTKAADVGADLVGKVEAGIPEDDPRNPATIADNVGDNVGDVAGMGADLFGSYVATVLASMVLGNYIIKDMSEAGQTLDTFQGMGPILLPLVLAGVGIIASIAGTLFIRIKDNSAKEAEVQRALNTGNIFSILITLIASWFLIDYLLPETISGMKFFGEASRDVAATNVFYATIVGLGVGYLISLFAQYYTAIGKKPVMSIVQNSSTGAATNIIAGLSVGMISTASSVLLFAVAIWGSYALAGFYGVAIAASAMMATTAMQLAIDAFGPIADNAGGVAEMSELPSEVRERTDILDSVGNTTAAIGKGFAIASAALTALALFAAYVTFTGIDGINIFKADVLAALFIGGMIPVVFSALAMQSVGKAAMEMVQEVRRQFKEIPGILEGKGTPDYAKCVEISTKAALKEMLLPGLITIATPVIIGLLMGPEALGSYMAGVAVSGVLWAIFQNNAGGAWDNAKKSFEAGVEINGKVEKKGSDAHKAAVTGDTVGDPFKDTSGPSMNILIKLTCLVDLVIAPILGDGHGAKAHHVDEQQKEIRVEVTNSTEGETIATITTITTKNGETSETIQEIVGSQEMIDSTLNKIKALKKE